MVGLINTNSRHFDDRVFVKRLNDRRRARFVSLALLPLLAASCAVGASATYLAAIPKLQSPEGIGLAASIQPVAMQHAAVLHFVPGEYPVPDVFAKTDKALAS